MNEVRLYRQKIHQQSSDGKLSRKKAMSIENRQSIFAKYANDYRYFATTLALSGKPIEGSGVAL
jgi:hypothetical protein